MTSQCVAVETVMTSQYRHSNIWLHSGENRKGSTRARHSYVVLFEHEALTRVPATLEMQLSLLPKFLRVI